MALFRRDYQLSLKNICKCLQARNSAFSACQMYDNANICSFAFHWGFPRSAILYGRAVAQPIAGIQERSFYPICYYIKE